MKTWMVLTAVVGLAAASCRKSGDRDALLALPAQEPSAPGPLALVLAPHAGNEPLDEQIRRVQQQVRSGRNSTAGLDQLGWLYVAKARESFDPGFYKLAEQCAAGLEARSPRAPEALLLRGEVLHNLHRFKEAETLADQLVAGRGLPADFGLLGDALMEQGKLTQAVGAYQRMADLKPDLHAVLRAAHVRWLKGDLPGAIELMRNAAQAVSPRDRASAAWVLTRLALYHFQGGERDEAWGRCRDALALCPEYPPALLLSGRMLLAERKSAEAVPLLTRAARLVPLPEYQWTSAEALEAAGQSMEARAVEKELRRRGAAADPRTFAVFLATRGETLETALRLAKTELESRQDVFTHDAMAWVLAAASHTQEAWQQMEQALAEGTQDGRLCFHAAVIASRGGDQGKALVWLTKAQKLRHLLLPSEREQLEQLSISRFPNQSIGLAGVEK